MPSFTEHPSSERVKLLLTGDSGSGKTGSLASLANAGYKLRIIDLDGGLDILANYLKPEAMDNVFYVRVPPLDEETWAKTVRLIEEDFTDGKTSFGKVSDWDSNTVLVIDSGTFLAQGAMVWALKKNNIPLDKMGFPQAIWGVVAKKVEELMAKLGNDDKVKCNLVITSHIKGIENEAGLLKYHPAFLGRELPNVIPRYMNNIWRIDVKSDGKRILRTQGDDKMTLKSSLPLVVKKEEELDLAAIFAKMSKHNKELRKQS